MKDRNVFSLNNFVGLDKENKPLKVELFRASDGENFIIDSNTLKTRPGIVQNRLYTNLGYYDYVLQEFIKTPLVDWYDFNGIRVFICEDGVFFEHKISGNIYRPQPNISSGTLITGAFNSLKGIAKENKPLFREEKDSLFIFGLGYIFVFAYFYGKMFFYDLKNKPIYSNENENIQTFFDNLPTPYSPTLYIGNNSFEDVNLLSKEMKYRIFAYGEPDEQGYITYEMPTHYDPEKNGSYQEQVLFYEGIVDEGLLAVPVLMGVLNEDFEDAADFGAADTSVTRNVVEHFVPSRSFEYLVTDGGALASNYKKSEIFDINKKEFFALRMENRSVFDDLVNYINENGEAMSTNKVLVYDVVADVIINYVNENTFITARTEKTTVNFQVYVQIKKFETEAKKTIINETKHAQRSFSGSSFPVFSGDVLYIIGFDPDNDPYTILPYTGSYTIPSAYINDKNQIFDFLFKKAHDFLIINNSVATTDARFLIYGSYDRTETTARELFFLEYSKTTPPTGSTIVSQTTFDVSVSGRYTSDHFTNMGIYDSGTQIRIAIEDSLKNAESFWQVYESSFSNNQIVYVKVKVLATSTIENPDPEDPPIFEDIVYVKIDYTKPQSYIVTTRVTAYYCADLVLTPSVPIANDGLYSFDFNEKTNTFQLKVKDYFYDYRNEPAIEVVVTFDNVDDDYNKIALCKFGTTFGSENRLFLAGHPDFPNVDRFNVSNDLLGENAINQSYEMSYFPSKNYRVLGGKGAINGYVTATDAQMYITKEEHPNDSKLFVRNRSVDENGIVSYFEQKTNINKTPINNKCLVRFANDILILDKTGLFAIELSNNVLTDERLIKMRSGFINKDLVNKINNSTNIFMLEDNRHLYIVADDYIYVADNRYASNNPNQVVENLSYEIMKWVTPFVYRNAHLENGLYLLGVEGENEYVLVESSDFDVREDYYQSALGLSSGVFTCSPEIEEVLKQENVSVKINATGFVVVDIYKYHLNASGNIIFDSPYFWEEQLHYFDEVLGHFRPIKKETVFSTLPTLYRSTLNTYFTPIYKEPGEFYLENENAVFNFGSGAGMLNIFIKKNEPISMRWVSAMTDFGNKIYEKTAFKILAFATRRSEKNTVEIGYKTAKSFNATKYQSSSMANPFDFDMTDFNVYQLSTFNEFGSSLPMKVNNFLYMQFIILSQGQVEINGIDVIYKNNRQIKTIA